ncbi:BrnT family toxin [Verminephrobacter eiseniae]|nr:BrnT family toxin [Verminephrobacter eiseniae]
MNYEFDLAKDESNLDKHGMSLADAEGFEWETTVVREGTREQYAEQRLGAIGFIGDRLHVMICCWRSNAVRVISCRIPDDHMVSCETDAGAPGTTPSWPA